MKPEALLRGKPPKTSARTPSMRDEQPVFASNGAPYLQMMSVELHSRSRGGRKGKGKSVDWNLFNKSANNKNKFTTSTFKPERF